MDDNIYRFKVGNFDCTVVNDGTYSYPRPGKSSSKMCHVIDWPSR